MDTPHIADIDLNKQIVLDVDQMDDLKTVNWSPTID